MGKDFEKQTKTIEDQKEKQVDALKSLESSDKQLPSVKDFISKERLNPKIIDEIEKTEEEERKVDTSKMVYKGYNKTYDFRKFKTILVFDNEIRNNIINSMANDEKKHLTKYIKTLETKTEPQNNSNLRKVKEDVINRAMALFKRREMVFKAFESGMFSKLKESKQSSSDVKYSSFGYDTYKVSKKLKDVSLENILSDLNDTDNTVNKLFTPIKNRTGLKILTPKQMLQGLIIALAQIKAGNNSKTSLNEIRQIVYSLYQSKEITKKVHNNIIKLIKV